MHREMRRFERRCCRAPKCRSITSRNTWSLIAFRRKRRRSRFATTLPASTGGRRIDVVVAIGDIPLKFVLEHRGRLFPTAPIVYLGVWGSDPRIPNSDVGITGVAMGPGYRERPRVALSLHPSTERVFVMAQGPEPRDREDGSSRIGEIRAAGQARVPYSAFVVGSHYRGQSRSSAFS